MANYIVRTLTEDGELESQSEYDTLVEALDGYNVRGMYTFDTESLFYPGDPFWTIQLVHNDTGAVLQETNSVLESLGLFDG